MLPRGETCRLYHLATMTIGRFFFNLLLCTMCSVDPSDSWLLFDSLLLSYGTFKKFSEKQRWVLCPAGVYISNTVLQNISVSSCSDLKLRVRILIDGTLIIFRVKPEDAGKYTCSPSNSLGISPSASAYLTVQCECYHGDKVEGEGWELAVRGDGNSGSSMEAAGGGGCCIIRRRCSTTPMLSNLLEFQGQPSQRWRGGSPPLRLGSAFFDHFQSLKGM